MKRLRPIVALAVPVAVLSSVGFAEAVTAERRWQVVNRAMTPLADGPRSGIHLDEADGDGVAWLAGAEIGDGVIELDLRGKDVFQRSFVGVAFHGVDDKTYEAVYFRPFNFKSEVAVRRSHAVQYISQPEHTWQRLRSDRPGKYEKPVQNPPDPNGWFHARVVLDGGQVRVFVDDAREPSLVVDRLGRQARGRVGLWVGNGSGGDFADLQIRALANASSSTPDASPRSVMEKQLDAAAPGLTELRHDLHQHPEPSGAEVRTAALVAGRLLALGLKVTSEVGGHGVVALLEGGRPGPVVAYRADMDAVRTDLPDPAPFRSQTPGVRHICGHDIHVAVALGVAEALAAVRESLPGSIKFIFQPAEENVQGAKAMLAAGALENPRPAAIFALHTAPLPIGTISCGAGMVLPGVDFGVVRLRGTGDLGAAARTLGQAILALNTVPPREMAARAGNQGLETLRDFVFPEVDPGGMQGEAWVMEVYLRASSEQNYARAKREIQLAVAQVDTDDVSAELDYQDRRLADTINDSALVKRAAESIRSVLGAERTLVPEGAVPYFGEDFSFFQKEVPGALLFLGVSNPAKGIVGMPHAPFYQADDDAILVGARALSAVLFDYLEQGAR